MRIEINNAKLEIGLNMDTPADEKLYHGLLQGVLDRKSVTVHMTGSEEQTRAYRLFELRAEPKGRYVTITGIGQA